MSQTRAIALAASLLLATLAPPAFGADPANGEKVFKKCQVCHTTEPGKNKIGPSLAGVFGRAPGTLEGFKYSQAMVAYGENGIVWDDETLTEYLADPRGVVKGTTMAFVGLKKEDDRADVIAHLHQFSE